MEGNSLLERITINPNVSFGKPTIRNLRYPVFAMFEYLAAGDSIEDLLEIFPDLEAEDFYACMAYAALTTKGARVEIPLVL